MHKNDKNSLLHTCLSSVANMRTHQLVLVEMVSNDEWYIHQIHREMGLGGLYFEGP